MKSEKEIINSIADLKKKSQIYNYDVNETEFIDGMIAAYKQVLGGTRSGISGTIEKKVHVKYELDKVAYKQFIADMKEIEAEFKQQNGKMSPERNAEITAEIERRIRTGEPDPVKKEDTTEHIPATLKDVCEWWVKTYPDAVFYSGPRHIVEIRDHMKVILKYMK
jgi:hypothetical protein